MRKFLLFSILLFCVLLSNGQQTYYWSVSSGNFDNANSWTPSRSSPAANDILIFDGSFVSNAIVTDFNPRESIGQLSIQSNCAVTFSGASNVTGAGTVTRAGNIVTGSGTSFTTDFVPGDIINIGGIPDEVASVISATSLTTTGTGDISVGTTYTTNARLNITGGSTALYIQAGCSLQLTATSPIAIYISSGTGVILGNLIFSGEAHRLNSADANAITFNSGSTFTQSTGFTGYAFTSTGVANAVTFTSGSTCLVNAGSPPFGLLNPSSKVVFNSGSIYKQTTGTPDFSGRIYSDVELANSSTDTGAYAVSIDNFTISGNSTINWNMTSTPGHAIKGNINVGENCTFNINGAGTLNLNGSSLQTISGKGTITIGSGATVINGNTNGINIAPGTSLSSIAGTLNLNGRPLTLKSDITGTASVGKITGSVTNGNKVTVENYIAARPVKTYAMVGFSSFASSIYNSWQEAGASTSNYGTQISGTYTGDGFDFADTAPMTSIYSYDDADYPPGSKWQGLFYTNNTFPMPDGQGYLLLIRGDRSVGSDDGPSTATTLRSTGTLAIGTIGGIYLSGGTNIFNLVANPYPCPIKWSTLTKQNLNGSFTVFDPSLQTFATSNGTLVSPSVSQQTANKIQTGQAFLVQNDASNNTPDLEMNETDKIIGNTNDITSSTQELNVNFYRADNSFADGAVAVFGDNNINALKFPNLNESISFLENGQNYSIDVKNIPTGGDTLNIDMKQMKLNQTYTIAIDASNFNSGNAQIVKLIDNVAGTQQVLDLTTQNTYSFTTTAADESGRLQIAFSNNIATPIILKDFSGSINNDIATLNWQTETEENFNRFEIEKSADAKAYSLIASVTPKGNNNNYSYNTSQAEKIAFYRLKMIDNDKNLSYSKIVRLSQNNSEIIIYPNPATNEIHMNANEASLFSIYNASGVLVKTVKLNEGFNTINIQSLSKGAYFGKSNKGNYFIIKFTKE